MALPQTGAWQRPVTTPNQDQHCGGSSAAVHHLPWIAATAFVLPALWAAREYGLVFDSQVWFPFGDKILAYLTGLGERPSYDAFDAYGPLAAVGSAVTSVILHDWLGVTSGLVGHHVFIVLCGAAIVGLTARLAADLDGPRLAVLAAALLAVSPRFFAETQNNISDVPAAVAWLAAIGGVVRALREDRMVPLLGAAAATGALGAIRVPNLPFLPAVLLVWLGLDHEARRRAWRLVRRSRWWQLAAIAMMAPLFLWLCRPLAWTAPRVDFWTVYDSMFASPRGMRGIVGVFFRGRLMRFGAPPSYHAVMLAVTTPLPQIAAGLIGAVVVWRRQRGAGWLLVSWLTVSLGRYAVLGLGNYDGVRHILDAFPALALLEAFGVLAVLDALARKGGTRARALQATALLVVIVPGATAIWRLHPYPMTYYNALVGGLHDASKRFETEYSGAVYREAIGWAADHLGERDILWITSGPYDQHLVQVEVAYLGLSKLRVRDGTTRELAIWQAIQGGRVFAVQNFRASPEERLPSGLDAASLPLVYEARREGVPLLRIREVPRESLYAALAGPAPHGRTKSKRRP